MPYLNSIEPLERNNIIGTANRPIIIHASDNNSYYCKYHNGNGPAFRLLKEFLIASFINYWNFNSSPFELIQVLPEHIPDNLGIANKCFLTPCFGSKELIESIELTRITEDILLKAKGKNNIRYELLMLSFFDILFCNEDRHMNNYNILLSVSHNQYHICPIDHEACFNYQNLDRELTVLTFEETLIYSSLFHKLFNNYEFNNKIQLDTFKTTTYLCYSQCISNIDNIISVIPISWGINLSTIQARLRQVLTKAWFDVCWNEFLTYLQLFISNTK